MPHPIRVLVSCGAKLPASRCRVCACCGEGAPPRAPGVYAGLVAPADPNAGAPPCTRVTFPSRGKSPKARQGLPPFGIPWCVVAALFALAALRSVSRRATFYLQLGRIFHFEFVGKSAFVSPELYRGNTPSSQSVARQLVCGLRAARSFAPFWGEQRGALLGG